MEPAGQRVIDEAKRDGSWTALDAAEALIEPGELKSALDAVPDARSGYDGLRDSTKKAILYWITSAKRDATRDRRIARTVESAKRGEPPVS